MQPRKPDHLPAYSEACLRAVVAHGVADRISVGGAFGLLHYLDYRTTRDVDAWWMESAGLSERNEVIQVIERTLGAFGKVQTRRWGDVVSVELEQDKGTVFSFQIARRSVSLEPPGRMPWIDVPLDGMPDLVGAKMTALVERGAPRDFRDIHALCDAGLITVDACWSLWRRRQELSGGDTDASRARLAAETHLARIAQHRPLPGIAAPEARREADEVRRWFIEVFLA